MGSGVVVDDLVRQSAGEDALLSRNYVVLTLASCVIATLGLIENSVAVIIGAMIIAPLMSPIQSFAYSVLAGDGVLVRRSLITAGTGILIAIVTSAALGAVIALPASGSEFLARTRPTLIDLGIAVAAGGVAGFARVRLGIAGTIAGTAIAVALMPPLCVLGLALSGGQWAFAKGAALLFGTNFLGIALACMAVYVGAGLLGRHDRFALVTTIAMAIALLFPLGASFFELVREARIEADIRHELIANTVTFHQVRLVNASFDWYTSPVSARLDVNAETSLRPKQIQELETFVARKTGQRLRLVVVVSPYEVVTGSDSPAPAAPAVGSTFRAGTVP
jgi:uncharacterized hydrophobic protein (TIGR00271 family)